MTHTHTQETAHQPPSLGSVLSRCPAEQGWVSLPFVTPLPGAVPGPQRAGRESPPLDVMTLGKRRQKWKEREGLIEVERLSQARCGRSELPSRAARDGDNWLAREGRTDPAKAGCREEGQASAWELISQDKEPLDFLQDMGTRPGDL